MSVFVVGLAGNPNSGKTTLFNALTGSRQRVGNWPGVTVAKKTGRLQTDAGAVELVDLPGIYSLTAPEEESAVDERITQSFLLAPLPPGQLRLVVNIVDASNLERNLYLTAQLLEMRVPLVIALNMMDVAADRRMRIAVEGLARRLGCPVVPIVASREQGLEALKAAGVIEVIPPEAPLTVFVWGKNRVVPVQVTEFSITEEAFDPALNPIRAKVDLGLTVLTYQDLGIASPGGALFMVHQISKEMMATIGSVGTLSDQVSSALDL